ncbi:MAG TPA: hypothetical protein VGV61_11945 [Thermoanaerobaculia bacterium]|nr:hypothetical protein [Thermoanaerobaculia bacterium]
MRLDTTVALFANPANGKAGHTVVESFTASYKASPRIAPLFRVSWVDHHAPDPTTPDHTIPGATREASGRAFSNPLVGLSYVRPLARGWRVSLFGASAIPVGDGGGDQPDPGAAAAIARGIPARSAMDNALFAVNYWTLIGGVGAAHVTPALTLQGEATVFQLTRVRGPRSQDDRRTNLTLGLHAGRFLSPHVSLGGELRLQRWLTRAAPVRANPKARETLTAALGPRFHFKVGGHWVRPGVSYTRSLDEPLRAQGYDMVQLDLPIAF